MINLNKVLKNRLGIGKLNFNPRTLEEALKVNCRTKCIGLIELPRSGTSILRKALNNIDRVYLSYEHTEYPIFRFTNKRFFLKLYYETLRQINHSSVTNKKNTYDYEYKYLGDKCIYPPASKLFKRETKKLIKKQEEVRLLLISREPIQRILSVINWNQKRNKNFRNSLDHQLPDKIKDLVRNECDRWNDFISFSASIESNKNVFLVDYDELISTPDKEMENILNFLEIAEESDHSGVFKSMNHKQDPDLVDYVSKKI